MLAIFLVESKSKEHDSDYKYIKSMIDRYYDVRNKISLKTIYMNGKTNYMFQKKAIKDLVKEYSYFPQNDGKYEVFLCIDIDDMKSAHNSNETVQLNKKIEKYSKKENYHIIWFCRDVEEVFLGKQINDKQKIQEAKKFLKNHLINNINDNKLLGKDINDLKIGQSNIKTVFDKYFYAN